MQLQHRRSLFVVLFFAVHALVLRMMGRIWWCACGSPYLWTADAWSTHTSQHLFDPYSFSHVQHGVVFCLLLFLLRVPKKYRLWTVLFLEGAWEILENTPLVIERYRAATASLSYFGDTIVNSEGDILACVVGYLLASRLPWFMTLAGYLAIEVGMLYFIRDSLSLNVLMLLYPLESIRAWQLG